MKYIKNLNFLFILITTLTLAACGGLPSAKKHAAPKPEPQIQETSKKPTFAPGYCSAVVAADHAQMLEKFVIDTYNRVMSDAEGFTPARLTAGKQPVINFKDPKSPRVEKQRRAKFHATLCSTPRSPHFKCEDQLLQEQVAARSQEDARNEYAKYYEKTGIISTLSFAEPKNYGSLFVGVPLSPSQLLDKKGQIISGDLHVSLVKVEISDAPESKALKLKFVKALQDAFKDLQASLPYGIMFDQVSCRQ